MYYWRAFNSDGELLCQAPITVQKAEAPVLKDGTVRDVGIYLDEHFLMTVGLSQPRAVTQGDFFCEPGWWCKADGVDAV